MKNIPEISVVIPTRNRRTLLERTLRSFEKQTLRHEFEVIVVDDGSTDDTQESVTRLSEEMNFPVLCLRQPKKGPASARNLGIGHARGKIIAFTDDDCIPDPEWLAEILKAFGNPGVWAVSGHVWSDIPPCPFVHSLASRSSIVSPSGHFMTSNFSVRREAAEKTGLFDTRFKDPWFEDYDFAYRIREAGGRIARINEAVIHHPPQYQSFFKYLRRTRFSKYGSLMRLKYPGRGFGNEIKFKLKKATLPLAIILVAVFLPIPHATPLIRLAILWILAALLAARRLRPLLRSLREANFSVKRRDIAAYILFDWLENLLHGIYAAIGIWRFAIRKGGVG